MIIRSLRWRLAGAMALIIAVVLAAAGLFSSVTVKREFDHFLLAQRSHDLREASAIVRSAPVLEDGLRRVHAQFGFRSIVVGEGNRIVAFHPPEVGGFRARPLPGGGVELSRRTKQTFEALRFKGGLEIPHVGTAYLLLPADGKDGRTRLSFRSTVDRWLMAGLAVAAVLAVVVMLTIFRRVFAPVEALTDGVRALAGGRLDARVPVAGNDEVADLGRAFNTMAEALERDERARRNMVNDVAHELRTPLTNIRVQVEAAQDGMIETDAFLASIGEEAAMLSRLVDDLQQLSLAESGQLRLEMVEVPVAEIVDRAVKGLPLEGRMLSRDVPGDLFVRADVRRIVQVVRNLLVNATTHARSTIDVRARRAGECVEIVVADDGPGVPPEHEERIFDRFHRADPSRSRATGGAGLGLAIAKQLVELHGGTVAYERPAFVVRLRRSK